MLGKLGKAGHKATLEEARRRFKEHVEGKQILSADLRSPVYLTVLKHGDGATLDIMLKVSIFGKGLQTSAFELGCVLRGGGEPGQRDRCAGFGL